MLSSFAVGEQRLQASAQACKWGGNAVGCQDFMPVAVTRQNFSFNAYPDFGINSLSH